MTGYEYILTKQIQWAIDRNIDRTDSEGGDRGHLAYTRALNNNLFEPLSADVRNAIENGDGNELEGPYCKMQAVHSSSAIGVNIFQYWKTIGAAPVIAAACKFCREGNDAPINITFEKKFQIIPNAPTRPNIDIVIECNNSSPFKYYAIECKFSEAYGSREHSGVQEKYLVQPDIWDDIPALRGFAESISPDDNEFKHLHPAQLIKHILGLKKSIRKNGRLVGKSGFRLLYLWYDVPHEDGARHRDEIARFKEVAKADDIHFHVMSYQELLVRLAEKYREEHPDYINYIVGRYL